MQGRLTRAGRWILPAVALLATGATAYADLSATQPASVQAAADGTFSYNVTITNKCPPDKGPAKFSKTQFHEAGTTGLTISGAPKQDTAIECGLSFMLTVTGTLADKKVAGASVIWVFYDSTWLPFGPGIKPYSPPPPPPPPPKKKDYSSLGSNTLAGAGGGALVNLATGVAEFTLGVGALVSGGLGALGSFVGTGVWLLIDPPPEERAVIENEFLIAGLALFFIALAALAGRLRSKPPRHRFHRLLVPAVAALLTSVSIGGLVGVAAGIVNLPDETMTVIMALTGLIIGIVDARFFVQKPGPRSLRRSPRGI